MAKYENAVSASQIKWSTQNVVTLKVPSETTYHSTATIQVSMQSEMITFGFKLGYLKKSGFNTYRPMLIGKDIDGNEMTENTDLVALPCPDYCGAGN